MIKPQVREPNPAAFHFRVIQRESDFTPGMDRDAVASFLHRTMKPWEDELADIHRAFRYCFDVDAGNGGFLVLLEHKKRLGGAVLFLHTGMEGFVPAHILLFIGVDPALRGQGLGRKLIERGLALCDGSVKLHVEYDNPAKRLYERVGFTSKYADMRLQR